MRNTFLLLFFFLLNLSYGITQFSQNIFYQENCHCMVVGDGQYGHNGPNQISFNTPFPSIIAQVKKVFLTGSISRQQTGYTNDSLLLGFSIQFNGSTIPIKRSDFSSENIRVLAYNPMDQNQVLFGKYFNLDVTSLFNPLSITQSLLPPETNSNLISETPIVEHYFLNIIYEDPSLPLTNIVLVSKNRHVTPIDKFILTGKTNPINTNKKIVLAVNASDICNSAPDTSFVFVNGQRCGELSAPEDNTTCSGVSGNFAFFSDSLIAYDNDTADTIFKNADGVANIQPYLTNSTELDIQFGYWSFYQQNPPGFGLYTNPMHQIVVAYTTTCEEFNVTTPEPEAVCKNEPLQLNVTGGNRYEWLPQRGLSCYDCPDPIVSTDSARFYTVRVWNNDSCSIVRPVHVKVYDLPKFGSTIITPTDCADSTGEIEISKHNSVSGLPLWSIDGGPFESSTASSISYQNLAEGVYNITLKDENGCTIDTTLEIGYVISTKADFSVNPTEGVAPLTVNVTNKSTHYTNTDWYLQGDYFDDSLVEIYLDPSGLYTLTLITWYKDPKCADTAEITILVYDTLVVSTPNVFTPNADGTNDFFGITSNQPATFVYTLFNRWGLEVYKNEVTSPTAGFTELWNGENYEEGVYYYKINVQADKIEAKEISGFFHLER
jgi:gliding motility-associated-like protein